MFAGGKGDDVIYGGPGTDDLTDSCGADDGVFCGQPAERMSSMAGMATIRFKVT